MKLIWLTDIHLNFLDSDDRHTFYKSLPECDGILISGDIAESHNVYDILNEMQKEIRKPIYFVLGNHDFYGGSIESVKTKYLLCGNPELFYLEYNTPVFQNSFGLVGCDGFADARIGDFENTRIQLNDHYYIEEFNEARILGKKNLFEVMREWADIDAAALRSSIEILINAKNVTKIKIIIVLTHVPPFKESAYYQRRISDGDFLPFYTSKATGDVLLEQAKANPDIKFIVLCGHTHSRACYQPLDNLTVHTGEAVYNHPHVQDLIIEV